ncbi:MAG: restriction endonuclease subunit S, partial [Limnospira maxima]
EQKAIAHYLDKETAKIDQLIEAKKRLLELLDEKRRALITHAVTRGLNPDVPMRDSGVEWIGEIYQKLHRLKYVALVEMGQSPPSTEYSFLVDSGFPFLQGTADFGSKYPLPRIYCAIPQKVAQPEDILFSVRGPVGELNIADREYGIGRGLCAIRCQKSLNKKFAWWVLHWARIQLRFKATGSTYEAVSSEDVKNLLITLPPLSEQKAIAHYLDKETAKINQLSSATMDTINLLQERRTSLITAAVTGQLKIS